MKISWCYDPCQRSSQRGWRILIPQQDKFMFLLSSTYKSEGVANFDPFMKISWCNDPCQRSSRRGWRILIPQQDKFMFLLSSTYKSEGVANFDLFMKISWGYGLDPLDHSPIPYQAPYRWWWRWWRWWWWCWWWWWWWWWFSWGVEQRPGWREHALCGFENIMETSVSYLNIAP